MYVCLECQCVFEEPHYYVEKHGLDTPPYEEFGACPNCGEAYVEAHICDCCGEYIATKNYIKTMDGERFCEDCIENMKLGDEY